MKLSEAYKNRPPKILMYGPPGSGKTALSLTLGKKLEVIDVANGLQTGLTLDDKFREDRGQVEVFSCTDIDQHWPRVFSRLVKIKNEITSGSYPFKAVLIDDLSTLADMALRQVMLPLLQDGKYRTKSGGPELQHWGLAITQLKNLCFAIQNLPIITILNCHDMNEVMPGTTDVYKKQIAVYGKNLPAHISGTFDELWYTYVKDEGGGKRSFRIQTFPSTYITCRSRNQVKDGIDQTLGMAEILLTCGYDIGDK
jgi:hypothetical protein